MMKHIQRIRHQKKMELEQPEILRNLRVSMSSSKQKGAASHAVVEEVEPAHLIYMGSEQNHEFDGMKSTAVVSQPNEYELEWPRRPQEPRNARR